MVTALALWIATADATRVQCEPIAAAQLLAEANVDAYRAPTTHPSLVPGMALGASSTPEDLRGALQEWCSPGAELDLSTVDQWETTGWSALVLHLRRTEQRGCTLYDRTLAISASQRPERPPAFTLMSRGPVFRTPLGDCEGSGTWRDERILDGEGGPIRLVLLTDREGSAITHAQVVVRRATAEGWTEQVLLDPAPAHLTGADSGPHLALRNTDSGPLIIAYGGRAVGSPCKPRGGQTVWRLNEETWESLSDEESLALLAREGLWRVAGDDGWLLIVGQDSDEDSTVVESRRARLIRRTGWDLELYDSSLFPMLNPGFTVIGTAPFTTKDSAVKARMRWGRSANSYVKQAWSAEDPCEASTP